MLVSAPDGADLMDPASWSATQPLPFIDGWLTAAARPGVQPGFPGPLNSTGGSPAAEVGRRLGGAGSAPQNPAGGTSQTTAGGIDMQAQPGSSGGGYLEGELWAQHSVNIRDVVFWVAERILCRCLGLRLLWRCWQWDAL